MAGSSGPALPVLLLAAALGVLQVHASSVHTEVTPVEKVIQLLDSLSAQIAEEGKQEAAQYDKFACFCKKQADEKLYAIEQSEKLIATLAAEIGELNGAISTLSNEISALDSKITGLGNTITSKTGVRSAQEARYRSVAADVDEAIDATERAIVALKESKGNLVNAKLDGGQLAAMAGFMQLVPATAEQQKAVAELLQAGQAPARYTYGSNEIIGTLEGLLKTFKDQKVRLDSEEAAARSAFELEEQDLQNQKKFAEKEKFEKEEESERKSEALAEATSQRDEETAAKDADHSFADVLAQECETKATEWDQRSQTRAQELTVINDAVTRLKSEASPNWSANKKLVGLQGKTVVTVASLTSAKAPASPRPLAPAHRHEASFLQLRGSHSQAASSAELVRRAVDLLVSSAAHLKSPVLNAISLKVRAKIDHFVEVRGIIKDLVKKLEQDRINEQTLKDVCDHSMAEAIGERDKAVGDIENAQAGIEAENATKLSLMQSIADFSKEIADAKIALKEAQELRAEEAARNAQSLSMTEEGKAAVEYAMQVLKGFYGSDAKEESEVPALVQGARSKYVPPNASRDGETVGDLAPEVWSGTYSGRVEEGKGILGLLEVMVSDFSRTKDQIEADERASIQHLQDIEDQTDLFVKEKEGELEQAKTDLSDTEDRLLGLQEDLNNAKRLHQLSLAKLAELRKMCVEGEETYEERRAKREQEIAALKEALTILESWKGL